MDNFDSRGIAPDGEIGGSPLAGAGKSRAGLARDILVSLRPKQWIKNLVVFAGLIFSQNVFNWDLQLTVWAAFAGFCAVVSAGYLINDVLDRERDRFHPVKKDRPIASGRVDAATAVAISGLLIAAALGFGLAIEPLMSLFFAFYIVLQLLYTFVLKHLMILDVLGIAAGFVLRAVAGGAVIHAYISPWLVLCTLLLALFLALAKRRAELTLLEGESANHRSILEHYSLALLDQMIGVAAAASLVSYSLYSFTALDSEWMMLTIPFVLYGLFRYLYLLHRRQRGGSPEQVLLTDVPLLINVVLWTATAYAVLHWT
ncbi:MAG: decaprenyl-phosphate phosphoribosyltransferase [Thermoleophilia bacterium]|nr:decaprenyl-phosphate phosphoribosyltransferase [Thermoleophilia bacterium]